MASLYGDLASWPIGLVLRKSFTAVWSSTIPQAAC